MPVTDPLLPTLALPSRHILVGSAVINVPAPPALRGAYDRPVPSPRAGQVAVYPEAALQFSPRPLGSSSGAAASATRRCGERKVGALVEHHYRPLSKMEIQPTALHATKGEFADVVS